LDFQ